MIISKADFIEIKSELLWIYGALNKLNSTLNLLTHSFDYSDNEDNRFINGVCSIIEMLEHESSFIGEQIKLCIVDLGEKTSISRRENLEGSDPDEYLFDPDHKPKKGEAKP
jgi:hypothetical protein